VRESGRRRIRSGSIPTSSIVSGSDSVSSRSSDDVIHPWYVGTWDLVYGTSVIFSPRMQVLALISIPVSVCGTVLPENARTLHGFWAILGFFFAERPLYPRR